MSVYGCSHSSSFPILKSTPVTTPGRTMVASLAWISVIVWGMILVVAGEVAAIIVDDFFRKCHLRWMTRDLPSATFWAVLATLWIVFMAQLTFGWWTGKVASSGDFDRKDSLWFVYISILTM
jgi:hypothetical protein